MLSDQKLVRTKKELSQQYVVCLSSVGGNNTSTKLHARHSFNESSFAYEYLLFPANNLCSVCQLCVLDLQS